MITFGLALFFWALFMIWLLLDSYSTSKKTYVDGETARWMLVGLVVFALFWGLFILLGALASGLTAFLP